MYAFLRGFVDSKKTLFTHLELKVLTKFNTVGFIGLVQLKEYAPMREGESQYEGGQARQIREFFKSLAEGDVMIVQVKDAPCMLRGKELCYEFMVSHKLPSREELDAELAKLEEDGLISEHTYPLHTEKQEQWVSVGQETSPQGESIVIK